MALQPLELLAPFPRSFYDAAASGPDVTFTPQLFTSATYFLSYEQVANSASAPGVEQGIQHFQFFVDDAPRPVGFEFFVDIPNAPGTNLTVQVYGTDQVLVPVTGSPVSFTTGWETRTVTVSPSAGTFTPKEPYTLRLLFNLGIGQAIKLAKVKALFWPYPI